VPELLKTSVSFQQAVVAALKYANGGMAVFPVRADKTPITPHGAKDATRDPASITAWWRLYPYAEIGWAILQAVGTSSARRTATDTVTA
jgi:hypothetical protein